MALPKNFIDDLLSRITLSSVVGKHVKLIRKGNRNIGLCPFHKEKTPSFHVRDDEGYYHCFGCNESGDAISFLRKKEGQEFMEAVRTLAAIAGVSVPQNYNEKPETVEKRKKIASILEAAARFYQSSLAMPQGDHAKVYLEERRVAPAHITKYRVGFAPPSGLIAALEKQGFSREQIISSGLARLSDRDGSVFEYFRNRLIFPITDNRGHVVAFGGRALKDNQQPKYLNSAESEVFHKKQILYGYAEAREKVRAGKTLLVVEGYMDVIAVDQSDVAAAVAPLGTALSEDHIQLIWRLTDQAVLCFDGDAAGKRAMLAAATRALSVIKVGKTIRMLALPPDTDPDDLIKALGQNGFSDYLHNSVSLVDGFWEAIAALYDLEAPEQRAKFWQTMREHIRQISDNQMRASIGDEIEARIRVMRNQKRYPGKDIFISRRQSSYTQPSTNVRPKLIIALLLAHQTLVDQYIERIGMLTFSNHTLEKMRQEIINSAITKDKLDEIDLRQHLLNAGYHEIDEESLLKGAKRIREAPSSLDIDEARQRLEELITHEEKKPRSKIPLPGHANTTV